MRDQCKFLNMPFFTFSPEKGDQNFPIINCHKKKAFLRCTSGRAVIECHIVGNANTCLIFLSSYRNSTSISFLALFK